MYTDVHCNDESHKVVCDKFMLEILKSIENMENERLPLHKSKVGNRLSQMNSLHWS